MKALFCSDLHLKGEKPVARLDTNWKGAQAAMLWEIVNHANRLNVPLVVVGDLFDHARVATEILNMVISIFKAVDNGVWILAGNHDLPAHSFDNVDESSIGVMLQYFHDAESLVECNANHFGRDMQGHVMACDTVRLTHQLIFPDKASKPPTDKGLTADELLDTYQEADWIICGDGHAAFHFSRHSTGGDRHVVNLGLTIRHKASELAYTPSVWLIDTDAELVDRIPLTDDPAMITREHLEVVEERESRVAKFIDVMRRKIGIGEGVTLSFMDNLEAKLGALEGDDLKALQDIIEKTKVESK